jgi:hypothetical protein
MALGEQYFPQMPLDYLLKAILWYVAAKNKTAQLQVFRICIVVVICGGYGTTPHTCL